MNQILINSKNMINALMGESNTHKEHKEKVHSESYTSKQGEILDYVNVKEDREQSLETNTVNIQTDENVELKFKDSEKIGKVMNDREGIIVDSLAEETWKMHSLPVTKTNSEQFTRSLRNKQLNATHVHRMSLNASLI
nr:DEP domain-containing protein [Tanacetum cinerariifolium]